MQATGGQWPTGRELSWKLVDQVPAKDATSSPRYPVGIWHVIVRFGFYPALLAAFVFLVNAGIVKKSHFKSDRPEKKAGAAATPAVVPKKPAAPAFRDQGRARPLSTGPGQRGAARADERRQTNAAPIFVLVSPRRDRLPPHCYCYRPLIFRTLLRRP